MSSTVAPHQVPTNDLALSYAFALTLELLGPVAAGTLTTLSPAAAGITAVNNPNGATGGADTESDFAAKRRAANTTQGGAQETLAWIEALAQMGDDEVLRAVRSDTIAVGTMQVAVISRGGGAMSPARLEALAEFDRRNDVVTEHQKAGDDEDNGDQPE